MATIQCNGAVEMILEPANSELRARTSDEKIIETLEQLEILSDLVEGDGKRQQISLPYSSDPRSFEEPWK